jgi:hypothetical protein
MKVYGIMVLFVTIFLIGCGEVQPIENKVEKSSVESNQQNEILEKLGINIEEKRISLDINKTAEFIKKMEIEMHGRADEIQHKIEKADINFTRDMGLVLSDEKVEIDLNKTKKMFQEINILMKEVLLDTNSSKN